MLSVVKHSAYSATATARAIKVSCSKYQMCLLAPLPSPHTDFFWIIP